MISSKLKLWKYQVTSNDIIAVAKPRFFCRSPRKRALLEDRDERLLKQMFLGMCPEAGWYMCTDRSGVLVVLRQPLSSRLSSPSCKLLLCALTGGSALVGLRSISIAHLCILKNLPHTRLWQWSCCHWLHCCWWWCLLWYRAFCGTVLGCCLSSPG